MKNIVTNISICLEVDVRGEETCFAWSKQIKRFIERCEGVQIDS